jgi:hypothetical protein
MLWRLKIVSISDEDASVLPAPLFMMTDGALKSKLF